METKKTPPTQQPETTKKLKLSRETVRVLTDEQLADVAGGLRTTAITCTCTTTAIICGTGRAGA